MVAFVAMFSLVVIVQYAFGIDAGLEDALHLPALRLQGQTLGRMKLLAGVTFLMASAGASLLLLRHRSARSAPALSHAASTIGTATALVALTVLLALPYGALVTNDLGSTPMAPATATLFLLLGIALIAAAGPASIPMLYVVGPSTTARLSRAFLPLTVLAFLVPSILTHLASASSLLNHPRVLALLATAIAVATVAVVTSVARGIGHQLDASNRVLRDSQQRYRAVFTESRDGIFVADAATGLLLDTNAAMLAMSGYRTEQLRCTPLLSLVAPEQATAARAAWEATARGGTMGAFEVELVVADGTRLPVEVRGSAYTDADGTIRLFAMVRDISERRQRERELRASEQRHRALFEEARDAIFIADPATGMLLDANRAGRAMTGCDVEALRRMNQSELSPPEERDTSRAVFAQDAVRQERRAIRFHVLHRDGRRTPVEISRSPITDESGRPLIVGVFRDVTERRAAEAAARESAERFRRVVEGAPEAVLTIADGKFTYLNPAALRLLGASAAEELLGQSIIERVSPEYRALTRERMRVLLEDLLPTPPSDEVFLRLNGTPFDVEVSSVPFPLEGRHGILTFFRDITERKRAAEELTLLSTALTQAAEVAVITDTDGTILFVNPAFERVTGYSAAEAVGENPRILKSGEQSPEVYRQMWDTLTAGQVYKGTFVNRRKNGDHYVAEVVVSPVRDASGKVVRYVGQQRDVTHEHDLEEQLRQSQKMEAVGQLTGGIAHDFNNLLGVILANASLLGAELQGRDPEARSYLADIERAAEAGSVMVKKLLAFGRRERLAAVPLALGKLLGEMEHTLRLLLPETIAIKVEAAEPGPSATADRGALELMVLNLATNARDAMPAGGTLTLALGEVELRAQDEQVLEGIDRPGRYACLSVSDTGTGMDAPTLQRMFEPFFTTKAPGAGTGLGLPMVFGLMKQHGGFVRVYSEPGQGTTVRLYFPATAAASTTKAPQVPAQRLHGTETILVVEDQEMLRRAAARALEKLGYRILVAADGEEGHRLFTEHAEQVRLVLSDRVMPQLGGVELYQRLRAEGHQVPFLLMSGYAADAGGIIPVPKDLPVIEKPWAVEDLASRIRALLDAPPPA
jgi:two-component system NtrC family sensor kinase